MSDIVNEEEFDVKQRTSLFIYFLFMQWGGSLDIVLWTPLRDMQVFSNKPFSGIFGGHHLGTDISTVSASLVASFLFAAFNPSQERKFDTLQDALESCGIKKNDLIDLETGKITTDHSTAKEISKILNEDLRAKGIYDLQPDLVTKERRKFKNGLSKEKYIDIVYKPVFSQWLSNPDLTFSRFVGNIFPNKIEGEITVEKVKKYLHKIILEGDSQLEGKSLTELLRELFSRLKDEGKSKNLKESLKNENIKPEQIAAFARIIPIFSNNQSDPDDYNLVRTVQESRQQFLDRLNKKPNKTEEIYNSLNDIAFNFWLQFFAIDLFINQSNAQAWSLKLQFLTIAFGVGFGIQKKLTQYFGEKKELDRNELLKALTPELDYRFKQDQLEYLRARLAIKNLIKEQEQANEERFTGKDQEKQKIENHIKKHLANSENREFQSRAQSHADTIEKFLDSSSRKIAFIATTASAGIGFSFIEWFGSSCLSFALSCFKASPQIISGVSSGPVGGLVALGSFLVGLVVGGTYFDKKKQAEVKSEKEQLREKYDSSETKAQLEKFKKLEEENAKLKQLINQFKKEVSGLQGSKFGSNQYFGLASQKSARATICGTLETMVARMGTGVLLFRSSIMSGASAFLKIAFFSKFAALAAISAVAWPVAVAGLAFGIVYGAVQAYDYVQKRKVEKAKSFIDNLPREIKLKENENKLLELELQALISKYPEAKTSKEIMGSLTTKIPQTESLSNKNLYTSTTPFNTTNTTCRKQARPAANNPFSVTISDSSALVYC